MTAIVLTLFARLVLGNAALPPDSFSHELEELLVRAQRGGPGYILKVNSPLLRIDYEAAHGALANGEADPIQPHDSFRTASVTKVVTAVLILRLQEIGRLHVEDRIDHYLGADVLHLLKIAGRRNAGSITVSELLGHTSGLYDYATDATFIEDVIANPQRKWRPVDLLKSAARGKPYGAPGEERHYSDTGYVLLGLIAENVTRLRLAQAYHQFVLDPLAMQSTYLEGREAARSSRVAHAYEGALDTAAFDPSFDNFGGGGLVSTADDLARLITGIFANKVFTDARSLTFMTSPPTVLGQSVAGVARFGHGLSSISVGDVRCFGHGGHWGVFMYYCPTLQLSVSGTSNQADRYDSGIFTITEIVARAAGRWARDEVNHAMLPPISHNVSLSTVGSLSLQPSWSHGSSGDPMWLRSLPCALDCWPSP